MAGNWRRKINMAKFTICIEETISETFDIVAKDVDEAIEIATKKYKDGTIILTPGNLVVKQMAVVSPEQETTEWFEF